MRRRSAVESQVGQLEATLRTSRRKPKFCETPSKICEGRFGCTSVRPMAQYELEKGCSDVAKILDASSVEIDTDRGRQSS